MAAVVHTESPACGGGSCTAYVGGLPVATFYARNSEVAMAMSHFFMAHVTESMSFLDVGQVTYREVGDACVEWVADQEHSVAEDLWPAR